MAGSVLWCSRYGQWRGNMSKFLVTVCAFGLLLSPAFAEDKTPEQLREEGNYIFGHEGLQKHQFTRVVPSGTDQRIGFFTALNPDCTTSGDVSIRITKEPEHGAVKITTATNFPGYPKENLRNRCNQHKVKGMQINYKSAEKYIGDDALELLVLFPAGFAWEIHFDVSVR
jgi:hypothetical protein